MDTKNKTHSRTATIRSRPIVTARNAAKPSRFYQRAFGAQERGVLPMPGGKIGHAELMIGNSI